MKNLVISFLAMLVIAQIAQADFTIAIASALVNSLWSLHSFGDGTKIDFLGATCTSKLKGRVRKFKWVWDSKFSCGGKFNGLEGSARGHKSRSGAIKSAINDFARKAASNGLLTAEDIALVG